MARMPLQDLGQLQVGQTKTLAFESHCTQPSDELSAPANLPTMSVSPAGAVNFGVVSALSPAGKYSVQVTGVATGQAIVFATAQSAPNAGNFNAPQATITVVPDPNAPQAPDHFVFQPLA